jgi:DNA-binding transcriptional ArsR family regulator
MRMCAHSEGSQQVVLPDDDQVDLAVEVFRMLADATRVKLLWVLLPGEASVNQLARAVAKSQTAVSQHLAKLRMAHLVQTRRQGTQVFYRVASDHIRQLVEDAIFHAEHASGGQPRHHANHPDHPRSTAATPSSSLP